MLFYKLNIQERDYAVIDYSISKNLIELLGPDPKETRMNLMKYGLDYFISKSSRFSKAVFDLNKSYSEWK